MNYSFNYIAHVRNYSIHSANKAQLLKINYKYLIKIKKTP
jgi:hypothetical protein